MADSGDLVATWNILIADGKHKIEFEHGTTSGKRIIRVDGKEIMRENWMFKLVGKEFFNIGKHKCAISIDAVNGFAYEYSLEVDNKSYEKFCENQSKILQSWTFRVKDRDYRVVLEKNTMDIWINGEKLDVEGEFTENGTVTNFNISNVNCQLTTISSGNRRSGLIHTLVVGGKEIPPSNS